MPPLAPAIWLGLLVVGVTLATLVLRGYLYGAGDHSEQVPLILRATDPNHLANDWYVDANSDFGPRWFYVHGLAYISEPVPRSWAFFAIYVVSAASLAAGLLALGGRAGLRSGAALVPLIAMLMARNSLGGNDLLPPLLVPAVVAMPLAVWGLVLGYGNRSLSAGLLLTATWYVHPLIGAHSVIVAVALAAFDTRARALFGAAVVGCLGAAPLIGLLLIADGPSIPAAEYVEIVAFHRHPWHYVPSQFDVAETAQFLSFLTIGVAALGPRWGGEDRFARAVALCGVVVGVLVGIGFVTVEIWPQQWVMLLQTARLTVLLNVLLAVIVAGWLARPGRHPAFSIAVISLVVVSALVPQALRVAAALAALVAIATTIRPPSLAATVWRSSVACLAVGAVLLPGWIQEAPEPLGIRVNARAQAEVDDVSAYIRNQTPADAVLLVPPYIDSFRLRANRAIVADFKAFPFEQRAAREWDERMRALTADRPYLEELREGWLSLSAETLAEIACRYGASYVVLERDRVLNAPALFIGRTFAVHAAPPVCS